MSRHDAALSSPLLLLEANALCVTCVPQELYSSIDIGAALVSREHDLNVILEKAKKGLVGVDSANR